MSDSDRNPGQQADAGRPQNRFFGRRALRSPQEALQPEAAPAPPAAPLKRPSQRRPGLSAFSGFLSFLLLAAVVGVLAFAGIERQMDEPGPLAEDRVVFIAPRTEVIEIIDQLRAAGVIDQPTLMKASLWLEGRWRQVKAGEYLFKRQASMRDVMDLLVSGRQLMHSVTIAEGLTSEQIVQRLREIDVLAGEIRQIPPEGTLLPETYRVPRGMSRNELIRKMQQDQIRLVDQIWAKRAPDLPLRTKFDLVTLASIVEKETGRGDERARVAAVFHNRLNRKMRLQSDPTIVYGLVGGQGTLGRPILRSEIRKPTAYNTYVIEGLPPGPIANPGRAALEAVANPSRTQEIFFVADGTGGHVFAETLDQHNRNVARWREIEREMRERQQAAPGAVDRAAPVDEAPAAPEPRRTPQRRGDLAPAGPVFGALGGAAFAWGSSATRGPLGATPILARVEQEQWPRTRQSRLRGRAALRAINAQAPSGLPIAPPTASAFAALVGDGNPAIPALAASSLAAEVAAGTSTFDPHLVAEDRPVMQLAPVSERRLAEMQARAARFADGESQSN
jgi:UPF0755 protein